MEEMKFYHYGGISSEQDSSSSRSRSNSWNSKNNSISKELKIKEVAGSIWNSWGKDSVKFLCDVGPERFLGPEIFFTPSLYPKKRLWDELHSLHTMVDGIIQTCPVDLRRALYGNIILTGGSWLLRGFAGRLQRELSNITWTRQQVQLANATRNQQKNITRPTPIEVNVLAQLDRQKDSSKKSPKIFDSSTMTWRGGAYVSRSEKFRNNEELCWSKKLYEECGANYLIQAQQQQQHNYLQVYRQCLATPSAFT